jgi:DNA-binding CsgD family transcriptional regulator
VRGGVADSGDRVTEYQVKMQAHAQAGRRAEAQRLLDDVLLVPPLPDANWVVWFMIDVAQSALLAGVPPSRVRDEFLGGWAKSHNSHEFVARHLDGVLRLAEGDFLGAVEALAAVLDPVDPSLYVPTVGSLRTTYASALLASGDRVGALHAVNQAMADLAAWPGWRRDRAEALAHRLEGTSGRADGELTHREREVAALVAEGLTNSQLAERLFISPKTAAVHVSNILAKLGLSSRAEVAAWAVRHGVVLQPG